MADACCFCQLELVGTPWAFPLADLRFDEELRFCSEACLKAFEEAHVKEIPIFVDKRNRASKMHYAGHINILHKGVRTLINHPTRGGTPVCSTTSPNASWVMDRTEVTCKRCQVLLALHDQTAAHEKTEER